MRQVIVTGNGLGRTLDNEFFALDAALEDAWHDEAVLDSDKRKLIARCLHSDEIIDDVSSSPWPKGEDQLGELQRVLSACDTVLEFEREDDVGWLSDHGKTFPGAIRSFIHRTACHFHQFDGTLPQSFLAPLKAHILDERSHIATLNYDDLLYGAFIGTEIFSGFSCMIDGFVGEFSDENMARFYTHSTCYYMHLHGSPLFITQDDGRIVKKSLGELGMVSGYESTHLVLTHVKYKPSIIAASPVLKSYWDRLSIALNESELVTVIGYGGGDTHLNRSIRDSGKQVRVIERIGSTNENESQARWNHLFGCSVQLVRLDSVLDFSDW